MAVPVNEQEAGQLVGTLAAVVTPDRWTPEALEFWTAKLQNCELDDATLAAEDLAATWQLTSPPNWADYFERYRNVWRRRHVNQAALPAASRPVSADEGFIWIETARIMGDATWWLAYKWPGVAECIARHPGHDFRTCRYCSEDAAEARTVIAHEEAQRRAANGEIAKVREIPLNFARSL